MQQEKIEQLRVTYAHPTPKSLRVQKLMRGGLEFEEAITIADREYTSDGEHLTQIGEVLGHMEVHA